ncbi:L-rhamnose mutarotase [Streptomyces sp. NBC_00656]|uniref:L-rhamnose mutarotase n=1 Tax=Streptomyces sp. NBC_00656 TaxID=2903668 RepID=UPI003246A4D9
MRRWWRCVSRPDLWCPDFSPLFAHFEYAGDDLAADLALMAADEPTQAWWRLTDPCQEPVAEAGTGERWASMEQVFLME